MCEKYEGSSCELVDAFVILTRQGVVLASGDARLTPDEDSCLYQLNQKLLERKRGESREQEKQNRKRKRQQNGL